MVDLNWALGLLVFSITALSIVGMDSRRKLVKEVIKPYTELIEHLSELIIRDP